MFYANLGVFMLTSSQARSMRGAASVLDVFQPLFINSFPALCCRCFLRVLTRNHNCRLFPILVSGVFQLLPAASRTQIPVFSSVLLTTKCSRRIYILLKHISQQSHLKTDSFTFPCRLFLFKHTGTLSGLRHWKNSSCTNY